GRGWCAACAGPPRGTGSCPSAPSPPRVRLADAARLRGRWGQLPGTDGDFSPGRQRRAARKLSTASGTTRALPVRGAVHMPSDPSTRDLMLTATWRRRLLAVLTLPLLVLLAGCGRFTADFEIQDVDTMQVELDIGIETTWIQGEFDSAEEL